MQADADRISCRSSKLSNQNHIIEQVDDNGNIQYNCTACRKVFRSRSQKYYHIDCTQLENRIFKCEHCEKSFARRTQWKYHTESHLSPENKCDKCQKIFSNPLALKKHLNLHNAEPKICPHCDKTFKKKISLDQHIFAQHLNQLQYGCSLCNKKYASKSGLQLHLQTHEKKRFECTFCGKLFQRNSILNLHIKRHNKTNSYMCTICQKPFSESGALARHLKLHQESVLQYYCKICDKSMVRKDNMTRHLTTIHPEKKFDEIVKIIKPFSSQQAVESDVSDYYKPTQDNLNSSKNFLIIENKLLREPFDAKTSINNFPQTFIQESNSDKCPGINQIKVITAAPSRNNEVFVNNSEKHSHEIANEYQITSRSEQTSQMSEMIRVSNKTPTKLELKSEFFKTECTVVEKDVINKGSHPLMNNNYEKNNCQPEELLVDEKLDNYQDYFDLQNNELKSLDTTFCNENSDKKEQIVKQTFSSVIKSVGNVKKDLTSNSLLSVNAKNQISIEYKHKKYCRNNYNIDLYRRILGFDEDDDDENIQKLEKYDHMPKSSTPVHWRKCFKNNYETSGS